MKTTKIQAEAKRVTTTAITFEIDGKKVSISEEDARAIYNELGKLFGERERLANFREKYDRSRNEPLPEWPYTPPLIVNTPTPLFDFTKITCDVNTGALS